MKRLHSLTLLSLAGCFVILPATGSTAPDKKQDHEKQKITRTEVRKETTRPERTPAKESRRTESNQVRQLNRQDKPRVTPERTLTKVTRTPERRTITSTTNRPPTTTTDNRDRSRSDNDRNRVTERKTPSTSSTNRKTVVNNRTVVRQAPNVRISTQQRQYNRSNRYGGLWFSANTHRSWNRSRQYTYNNR